MKLYTSLLKLVNEQFTSLKRFELKFHMNSSYENNANAQESPEWKMGDDALRALLPVHLVNSVSTVTSPFGFWAWLFFSPYNSDVARALNRKCTKEKTR